jgi:nucleoside-diphosphate-sugar epimerase
MRYVISGATSGTGDRVIQTLVRKVGAENITCLVRPTSSIELIKSLGVHWHLGDVVEPETYRELLGPDTIYIDLTHPKYYHNSIDALRKGGVERAYFVTTTGIFSRYHRYSDIYKAGEERIRESRLVYTILRPSMIYGSLRDKNMHRLIKFLDRAPVFPLFGAGRNLMQPVFVDDLTQGIISAIDNSETEYQEYNLAGPRGISYRYIVETVLRQLERKVTLLNVGMSFAAGVARYAQYIPGFPVNHEQVLRLLEDKVFDISKATAELNYTPRDFAEGIAVEIEEMRSKGVIR